MMRARGIDGGTNPLGVQFLDPPANKAEIEVGLGVSVEVGLRNEIFEGDGDRFVEAGLRGTEHRGLQGDGRLRLNVTLPLGRRRKAH